nr:Chain B, D(2) DOPAMINE RECEPTOR [Homo sapiens]5AER_C Chain C, D(2) DOPAMINE RECEPTOR [Homo sapiens]
NIEFRKAFLKILHS